MRASSPEASSAKAARTRRGRRRRHLKYRPPAPGSAPPGTPGLVQVRRRVLAAVVVQGWHPRSARRPRTAVAQHCTCSSECLKCAPTDAPTVGQASAKAAAPHESSIASAMRPCRSRLAARAATTGCSLQPEAARRARTTLHRCGVAKRFAARCMLLTGWRCCSRLLGARRAGRGAVFDTLPLILRQIRRPQATRAGSGALEQPVQPRSVAWAQAG